MSLQSIVQSVVDEAGLPRVGSVASGPDDWARQLFALANATLRDIQKCTWPLYERQYAFTTVAGQAEYDLPADWARVITDTVYLASSYYQMRGSLSPSDWQWRRNGMAPQTGWYKYRVYGSPLKLHITPTPETVEDVVLEYVTKNIVKQSAGTYVPRFSDDEDTVPELEDLVALGLKWRIKHAKGLDYAEDYNEYEASKKQTLAQMIGSGSIPVAARNAAGTPELTDGYVRENQYGA
jgi:hypothetical protein